MKHKSIQCALELAKQQLQEVEEGVLKARLLLSFLLGMSDAKLRAFSEQQLSSAKWKQFEQGIHALKQGTPLAYVVGQQAFWQYDFKITPDVLVPRQDTEILLEAVLEKSPQDIPIHCLDLGTGSGILAICLAKARPNAIITAVDNSRSALQIAKENAMRLEANNVQFLQSHWFQNLSPEAFISFDIILSNPPYIAPDDPHLTHLNHEPYAALVSEEQGLGDIKTIIQYSHRYLKPNGWLLIEHGYCQAADVTELFQRAGYQDISTKLDLLNHPRVTLGQKSA